MRWPRRLLLLAASLAAGLGLHALRESPPAARSSRAAIREPTLAIPARAAAVEITPTRASEAAEGAHPPPPPSPPSTVQGRLYPVKPSHAEELGRSPGWIDSLRVLAGLPRLPGAPEQALRLARALEGAEDPVSRQNIIFLAALTLPWPVAEPWLRAVRDAGDPEDGEDALCALAFSGDPAARGEFRGLSGVPSRARVHRLLPSYAHHEELGEERTVEAREVLRSYRAIEVLDREPYFKRLIVLVPYAWLPHPAPSEELSREIQEQWLARYPGHPGSDDIALRLARLQTEPYAAARWYARSACLPDQDVTSGAVLGLLATCELLLRHEQLDWLAHERALDSPCRALVQYVRLRRIAAEQGFARALAEAEGAAHAEPDGAIAGAWRHRWAAGVPQGVESGWAPLAADDPLRDQAPPVPPASTWPDRLDARWRRRAPAAEEQLSPSREPVQLDARSLASQFRAWETLAELERRAAGARRAERSDLLYKQAAIFFHDPGVLFPVYGTGTTNFQYMLQWRGHASLQPRVEATLEAFEESSYSSYRAIALFDRIEREDAGYAAMDRVLFSRAVARKRALDFPAGLPRPLIPDLTRDLERCSALFPGSPLADDSARAAAWWRSAHPAAFHR
ncbi:MAG: hypothetical protein ACT4PV_10250 [Planctomycetaceae bacterium]